MADALTAYFEGDLLAALAAYPPGRQPASGEEDEGRRGVEKGPGGQGQDGRESEDLQGDPPEDALVRIVGGVHPA